jgi:hypothetical protein
VAFHIEVLLLMHYPCSNYHSISLIIYILLMFFHFRSIIFLSSKLNDVTKVVSKDHAGAKFGVSSRKLR